LEKAFRAGMPSEILGVIHKTPALIFPVLVGCAALETISLGGTPMETVSPVRLHVIIAGLAALMCASGSPQTLPGNI